jgi:hypothetical protein
MAQGARAQVLCLDTPRRVRVVASGSGLVATSLRGDRSGFLGRGSQWRNVGTYKGGAA